jgi:serine/tyrosine/threonine adenylyltransferase
LFGDYSGLTRFRQLRSLINILTAARVCTISGADRDVARSSACVFLSAEIRELSMCDLSAIEAEEKEAGWKLDNTYARLPSIFAMPATPAHVREQKLTILNERLADGLGLNLRAMRPQSVTALFAGQGLSAQWRPIAQAYAGHQFGGFTMLGDGRAILLGEHRTPHGDLVDIQLKGAGRTQFSRGGDGLAALGPMLREYVISEAMSALGIPTTRSLAVVTTGEPVYRESVKKGAILTRVASSHVRVGTFQYLAARQDKVSLRILADYCIDRHFRDLPKAPEKYLAFLQAVVDRQAALIARWQLVGFIHGVMNTDNMAISGETIDYGPCAFMDDYDPKTVFSSIDQAGRYAYGNQPAIAQWNLMRFAETLLPLIDPSVEKAITLATELLDQFHDSMEQYWLDGMRAKLGLRIAESDDLELIQSLLRWMHERKVDFTNTFRDLSTEKLPTAEPYRDANFLTWHSQWQRRLLHEAMPNDRVCASMRAVNPAVIPRNHQVEAALHAAEDRDDLSVLHHLLAVLATPYDLQPESEFYREPPADRFKYRTFCGT